MNILYEKLIQSYEPYNQVDKVEHAETVEDKNAQEINEELEVSEKAIEKDDAVPGGGEEVGGYFRPDLSHIEIKEEPDMFELTKESNEKMDKMLEELYDTPWKNTLLLSIAVRLGIDVPEKRFMNFFRDILCMKETVGILGGQNEKAYYIIGFNGIKNKFYYLDPHYVNSAVNPKSMDLDSYVKKTIHEYNYKNMNSSL